MTLTTATTGWLASAEPGTALAAAAGATTITPTACFLGGASASYGETTGLISDGPILTDGTGTYFCAAQTSQSLQIVQFEITRANDGAVYARPTAAGYVDGANNGAGHAASLFGSATSTDIADSATSAGFGIQSLTYSARTVTAGSDGTTCEDKYAYVICAALSPSQPHSSAFAPGFEVFLQPTADMPLSARL